MGLATRQNSKDENGMKVLGIDPGLRVSGYAVIESHGREMIVHDAGVLRIAVEQDMADRLAAIWNDLSEVIHEHRPDAMAVESLWAHYKHPRTAIQMGHARGVILAAAAVEGLSVYDYPPARIKKSLMGNGRANKAQMQAAVQRRLGLAAVPEPHDVADAMAIALCCLEERQRAAILAGNQESSR